MMKAKGLAAGYGRNVVVDNIELQLLPGEFNVVIGPNASGKSTFLKTLAAVIKPLAGTVYLSGEEIFGMNSRLRARHVAAVFTGRPETGLNTVEEVVALGRYPWTGPVHFLAQRDKEAVEEALKKTGILHLRGRKAAELSDGQFQRMMIARALAQKPEILILDEPTTHLDAKSRIEIILLLRKVAHAEKISVIASTHEIELALRFADKIILVEAGRVSVFDDVDELVQDPRFQKAFGLNSELHLSPTTFSIELRANSDEDGKHVFVIAGGGTGSKVYRALSKAGIRVSTGVLHQNDIDHHVAVSMGLETIAEKPFTKISETSYQEALRKMLQSDAVVYTSPPIGEANLRNIELLQKAVENKLPSYTFAAEAGFIEGVETVSSVNQLVAKILRTNDKMSIRETCLR